jgi:hypothetical protein
MESLRKAASSMFSDKKSFGGLTGSSKVEERQNMSNESDGKIASAKAERQELLKGECNAYRSDLESAILRLTIFPEKYFAVPEDHPGFYEWSNEDEAFPGSGFLTLEKYKELFCEVQPRSEAGKKRADRAAGIFEPVDDIRVMLYPLSDKEVFFGYISISRSCVIATGIFKTSFQWPVLIPDLIPGLDFSGPAQASGTATRRNGFSSMGEHSGSFRGSDVQSSGSVGSRRTADMEGGRYIRTAASPGGYVSVISTTNQTAGFGVGPFSNL